MSKVARTAAVCCVLSAVVVISPTPAAAGSGLNQTFWGQANFTVSISQNSSSNVVGFWQTVAAAFGCIRFIDGSFGSQTQATTKEVQGRLGIAQTGVVTPFVWNTAMAFSPPGNNGALGLQPIGPPAYSYQNYDYYAGGGSNALLRWTAYFGQWGFDADFSQSGLNWQSATSNRTSYSYFDPSCPA